MAKRSRGRHDSAHISFRINNPAVVDELAAKAVASGSSPNLIARQLVTDGLTKPDEVMAAVDQINAKLNRVITRLEQQDIIQQKLERGIFLLLRFAGKLDPAQAKTAMERYFSGSQGAAELEHALHQENGPGK